MTPEDIATTLTWANQNDPLITIDDYDVRFNQWTAGLSHVQATAQQACYVISAYYGNTPPGRDGRVPSVTPQVVRSRLTSAKETAQARRDAAAALPPGKEQTYADVQRRVFHSPEFQERFNQGRRDRADRLASRGIDPTPRRATSKELDDWEAITGHTATR